MPAIEVGSAGAVYTRRSTFAYHCTNLLSGTRHAAPSGSLPWKLEAGATYWDCCHCFRAPLFVGHFSAANPCGRLGRLASVAVNARWNARV